MELISFIKSKIKLSDNDYNTIDEAFKTETHSKGKQLILPYSSSQRIYFVEKGLVRTYYYKDDKDITLFFFNEGKFTAPLSSIFYNKTELYGWETLERSTLRSILYQDLQVLTGKYPVFHEFFFHVSIEMLNLFALKLESLQFQTAEQRYNKMMETYPEIMLRVSLGHIASYLGITQQTLSVIRGKK